MATIFVLTTPYSSVDYSLIDGKVRAFVLQGVELYNEEDNLEVDGWRKELVDFVLEQKLHIDKGYGLNAFVYRLQDDGILPECAT
jgi:hypothetical protein